MPVTARPWPVWVGCAVLALAFDAQGQGSQSAEPPTLISLALQAREARLKGDKARWLERGQQASQLAPEHPDLLISVGRALAAHGRFDDAVPRLENAVRRGAAFDLAKLPEFTSAPDTPQLRAIREQALRNMVPVAAPELFLELNDESLRTEGITWDPVGEYFYIGSLSGEIWRFDLDRKLERFAGEGSGLREVLGLKVDAERRLLWAVTGVFPDPIPSGEPKKNVGTTGLHAYDIETGKRVRDCGLDERPTLHGFNDMALAKDGTVYVTDSPNSSIYKLAPTGCKLERVVRDLAMSFPNGIVLTPDESRLYVGHVEGISAIEVRTGKRVKLSVPVNGAANSIDGLVWDRNDLLGVQGNPYLARVARIRLGDDGLSIREVTTMSSRPTPGLSARTGVIVRDHFYITADSPQAAPGEAEPLSQILRAPVR